MKGRLIITMGLLVGLGSAWGARGVISEEDRQWWAFQPVVSPSLPVVKDAAWAGLPVDRFVLAKLEAQGLRPASEAGREDLVRRLTLDLWGLPPTPEESAAFVNDAAPGAYERLLDRLLASPHYGERWARHWLDLVRYADSDGYKADAFRPDAWRYRDYVVRSFNEDKSYAQFVQEQLAGDEISPNNPDALIATGYLRHWIYEYNNRDVVGQRSTILNDITDTTADVFLGLGLQCARCHDHKFDPLLQKDYFSLQACFTALVPVDHTVVATAEERKIYDEKQAQWSAATKEIREQIETLEAKYKKDAERKALKLFPEETQALLAKPASEQSAYEQQLYYLAYYQVLYEFANVEGSIKGTDKETLVSLRKQLAEFDKLKPAPLPTASTVADLGTAAEVLIPKRENLGNILPGVPTILNPHPLTPQPVHPAMTGRRTALAKWLTEPSNPLTARVMVNRIWQSHFGRGLTSTTSDFGHLGDAPSHPELLDWLTSEFISHNWSLKHLHRLMLTSATYRQGSNSPCEEEAKLKDPENRLLWRWRTQRLSAEQIRDALFAATGELDLTTGGPSVDFTKPRRTIYNKVLRNVRDPLLDVFDAPQHFNSTPTRDTTTTPVQSLLLINHRQLIERSQSMAQRLEKAHAAAPHEQIRLAYQLLYSRQPNPEELAEAEYFLEEQTRRLPTQAQPTAPFVVESMPQREGKAVMLAPGTNQERLVTTGVTLPNEDFTIEAVVLLRSIYENGELRYVASTWNGDKTKAGWALGITGAKSQRKPQMLALQVLGAGNDGKLRYEPVFSDLQIQLDRSYYVAASVHYGEATGGTVTFYLKDLADDDVPMRTTICPHPIVTPQVSEFPLTIGARSGSAVSSQWDGLIDEVRLRSGPLAAEECFYTQKSASLPAAVLACWQFEPTPGFLYDAKLQRETLLPPVAAPTNKLQASALADLCHAMLNSNEFLYVR